MIHSELIAAKRNLAGRKKTGALRLKNKARRKLKAGAYAVKPVNPNIRKNDSAKVML